MKNLNKIWSLVTASALSLILLTGCGANDTPAADLPANETGSESVGTLLLSVNPEIEVEYDRSGLVLEIEGINDDGRSVLQSYTDYKGRSCDEVVNELVAKIYQAGYFEKTVDGKARNIVIKLEDGSSYPDGTFLEEVAEGVRQAVSACGVTSKTVTVDRDDLDDRGYIGLEKAKDLVLTQLGLNEADFQSREYELDDGVYEMEFTSGGVEYEFEVDARSGKVLEADRDRNDDWGRYDDDVRPVVPAEQKELVGLEDAKAAALSHLGLKDAYVVERDIELDDGKYEFEIISGGVEYDVEVNARTGAVVEADRDDDSYDDDRDDRDDRDDWDDRDDDDRDDDDDWDD